jgi:hypothetical protein
VCLLITAQFSVSACLSSITLDHLCQTLPIQPASRPYTTHIRHNHVATPSIGPLELSHTQHNGIFVTLGCHAAATKALGLRARHSQLKTAACTFKELRRRQLQFSGPVNEEVEPRLFHPQNCSCARFIPDGQPGCGFVPELPHRSEVHSTFHGCTAEFANNQTALSCPRRGGLCSRLPCSRRETIAVSS